MRVPCSSEYARYIVMLLLAAIRGGSRGHRSALLHRAQYLCQISSRPDERRQTACPSVAHVQLSLARKCSRALLKDVHFAEVSTHPARTQLQCSSVQQESHGSPGRRAAVSMLTAQKANCLASQQSQAQHLQWVRQTCLFSTVVFHYVAEPQDMLVHCACHISVLCTCRSGL